jgi:hypothetical protein
MAADRLRVINAASQCFALLGVVPEGTQASAGSVMAMAAEGKDASRLVATRTACETAA